MKKLITTILLILYHWVLTYIIIYFLEYEKLYQPESTIVNFLFILAILYPYFTNKLVYKKLHNPNKTAGRALIVHILLVFLHYYGSDKDQISPGTYALYLNYAVSVLSLGSIAINGRGKLRPQLQQSEEESKPADR